MRPPTSIRQSTTVDRSSAIATGVNRIILESKASCVGGCRYTWRPRLHIDDAETVGTQPAELFSDPASPDGRIQPVRRNG
jgi:hypothetical protein